MSFGKLGQRIRGFFSTLTQNFLGEVLVSQTYSTETTGSFVGSFLSMEQPTGTLDGAELVQGSIISFEPADVSRTLVTCAAPHGRDNIYLPGPQVIVIAGGTPYDGSHNVYAQPSYDQIPNSIQFILNTPFTFAGSGSYIVQNMTRILSTDSNRPRRSSVTPIQTLIAGTTNYNGTKTIYNALLDSFEIANVFVSSQAGTWAGLNETQINTDGVHGIVEGGVAGLNGGPHSSEVYRARNIKSTSFEIQEPYVGTSPGTWVKGEDMFIDGPSGSGMLGVEEGQYCFFDIEVIAFGTNSTANCAGYKGNIIYRRGWNHGVITPWGSVLSTYNVMHSLPGWSPKVDMSGLHSEKLAIMVTSTPGGRDISWVARISGVSGIGYVGS